MSTPDSPPPPYRPDDPFPAHPPVAPSLEHEVAPRRGRRWRGAVAGAVAGGVLAAAVAVPVTWAFARVDDPAAPASSGTLTPQDGTAPTVPEQQLPQLPDQGSGQGGFGGYGAPGPYGESTSTGETDATDDQSQGVVLIDTTLTNGAAAGSGLVLDDSGLVLTNYHVVEGSTNVQVTIATTGETYTATVVGHDQDADIALLQLDDASGLTAVALDDDGDPAVSDEVTAVGNAQGQGYLSASTGDVVALDQSITTQSEGSAQGERLTGLIETDAYVVGGYSGGALLDGEGEVVGITTAASGGGIAESYAVPIDDALTIAHAIESGDEGDGVEIGATAYLGLGIANTSSLQIASVESGSAADEAGITAGDTLTSLGGTAITSYDVLRSTLGTHEPGDRVSIGWTDSLGRSHTATVTLGASPVN
ncbi:MULTISPECIES: S1C family serine protease [unclassified Nocardioides]|uniref:S1C family serine protease n=1 Tax=unclassified Nocardioides TaxID=2615069 RepID=UPI0009EFB982|nr:MULTISPECIES: trypsin-like peptidase domain-containing protein [unclassified Nocardioides]GAW51507.1 Putative serine protease [Nocardioides sp. PD653-B2]GAW56118.1 putative serine protease [Nocardioides sp. PD653]